MGSRENRIWKIHVLRKDSAKSIQLRNLNIRLFAFSVHFTLIHSFYSYPLLGRCLWSLPESVLARAVPYLGKRFFKGRHSCFFRANAFSRQNTFYNTRISRERVIWVVPVGNWLNGKISNSESALLRVLK